jgi:hypothetical protein
MGIKNRFMSYCKIYVITRAGKLGSNVSWITKHYGNEGYKLHAFSRIVP